MSRSNLISLYKNKLVRRWWCKKSHVFLHFILFFPHAWSAFRVLSKNKKKTSRDRHFWKPWDFYTNPSRVHFENWLNLSVIANNVWKSSVGHLLRLPYIHTRNLSVKINSIFCFLSSSLNSLSSRHKKFMRENKEVPPHLLL